MPPTKHSPYGASVASRWMNCPGSVAMSRDIVERDTPYAIEGSAAHVLAEAWLTRGDEAAELLNAVTVFRKDGTHEMVPVTPEMRDHVRLYVAEVRRQLAEYGARLLVEQRFDLAEMHPPPPGMWGTADAVIVGPRALGVVDLKYGVGVLVEVRDNPQLRMYALGAWLAAGRPDVSSIHVTIVQPRAEHPDGPVRTETLTLGQVHVFGIDAIRAAWIAYEDTRAEKLRPGKWCRFCPAQAGCPALLKKSQELAQVEFEAMPLDRPPTPEMLPIAVRADILSKAHILEDWLDAVRASVTAELEAGRPVPGWKLVWKRATRSWTSEPELVAWAKAQGLTDADIYAEPKVKSPAQMEKVVGKKAIPDHLVQSVSTGTTLTRADDPRKEAAIGPAHEFKALPSST